MNRYMARIFWVALVMSLFPMTVIAGSQDVERKLVEAASAGRLTEVSQLITKDVDLSKGSALRAAVNGGHLDVVRYLIEKGADPNQLLVQHGFETLPLFAAARDGRPEMLEYLISHGADVNYEGPSDTTVISTPLLAAVYYGDLDTARLLIQYGADVNYVSRRGNTALIQAVVYSGGDGENDRSAEFVDLLLSQGANPDVPDRNGITARQYATFNRHPDLGALIEKVRPAPAGLVQVSADDFQAMNMVLLTKESCDRNLPGFKENSAADYLAWRKRYAPLIAQIENSPGFKENIARTRQGESERSRAVSPAMEQRDLKLLEEVCEDFVLDQLAKEPNAGPNPNLANPELTWKHFMGSLRTGDRDAALSCLTSTARSKFRGLIKTESEDFLRSMAESIKTFQITMQISDDLVEGFAAHQNGKGGMIYFQNKNGEWRISEM